MKPRYTKQRNQALTLVEVLVIVVVLFILAAVLLPTNGGPKKAMRINCANNLHQIGLAYRVWGGDSMANYPMQNPVMRGGTKDMVDNGVAYRNFQVISNQLNQPKLLICPSDVSRIAATNFTTDFSNINISYFASLDADDTEPQTILSGDDNFEIGGVPVKAGLVNLYSNTPIAWTTARHNLQGNILLADGSVQQVSQNGLRQAVQQTGVATNRLAIP